MNIVHIPQDELEELIRKVDTIYEKVNDSSEWLTVEQVAQMIHRTKWTVRRIKDLIGYSKPDSDIMFRRIDVQNYMMRHYKKPKESNQVAKSVAR